jgi:glutaminyl-peptide cyclotransferase
MIVQHGNVGRTTLVSICMLAALSACSSDGQEQPRPPAAVQLRAEVIQQVPHDPTAFTQGLELVDGVLYEGTGIEGSSDLRTVDPATGEVKQQAALPPDFFGEGITAVGQTIWQLTWQEGVAIQRDRASLSELRRVSYQGEGWGICHDTTANRLIMSDGTDKLTFRDPQTFQQTGDIRVTSGGSQVGQLNELECVNGTVFANVWNTDTIVRIDPKSGQVTADVNLAGLLPAEHRATADVLNGIAAVPGTDEFLVTGKYWPTMYRVKFVPATT